MTLLLATTNANKVREIRALAAHLPFTLLTLADVPAVPAPEETGATFWENARIKALAYARATGCVAIAEDSGLEVAVLGGEPGVQSAQFLGPGASYADRFDEILRRLAIAPHPPRAARFVTAIAVADGTRILCETQASIDGLVAMTPSGAHGFGYDPIFFYPPLNMTTAEMTQAEKATVSHRSRAFRDLWRLFPASHA